MMTTHKAWVAAIGSGLVAFLTSLITALDDNAVSTREWLVAVVAALVGSGVVGGATYQVANKVKTQQ